MPYNADREAEEQLQAEVTLLCQALQLLQGLLLLHRPSAQLFERKSNIEVRFLLSCLCIPKSRLDPSISTQSFLSIRQRRSTNPRTRYFPMHPGGPTEEHTRF